MARLPRIVVPDQPLHIMHRGNNRHDIFESEEDMSRIKEDIEHSLLKSGCSLHAYVIMTNHLHLLITEKTRSSRRVLCSLWRIDMFDILMRNINERGLFGRDVSNHVWLIVTIIYLLCISILK